MEEEFKEIDNSNVNSYIINHSDEWFFNNENYFNKSFNHNYNINYDRYGISLYSDSFDYETKIIKLKFYIKLYPNGERWICSEEQTYCVEYLDVVKRRYALNNLKLKET